MENTNNNNQQKQNNEKMVKFVPDKSLMTLSTDTIAKVINANLQGSIPDWCGSRVKLKGNAITIQIAFLPSTKMVTKNAVADIFDVDDDEIFTLTKEGKEVISAFVDVNQNIPMEIARKRGKRPVIIITLNPMKTLDAILEPCPKGYKYTIDNVYSNKSNTGLLLIALNKIQNKNKNNNNNNNRK